MPPYCLVCSRDLATDVNADGNYCGDHSPRRIEEAKRRRDYERGMHLPLCRVHFPYPYKRVVADEYARPDRFKQRIGVTPELVVARRENIKVGTPNNSSEYWDDGYREFDFFHASDVLPAIQALHRELLGMGWRPTCDQYRPENTIGSYVEAGVDFRANELPGHERFDPGRWGSKWVRDDILRELNGVYRFAPSLEHDHFLRLCPDRGTRQGVGQKPRRKLFGIFGIF